VTGMIDTHGLDESIAMNTLRDYVASGRYVICTCPCVCFASEWHICAPLLGAPRSSAVLSRCVYPACVSSTHCRLAGTLRGDTYTPHMFAHSQRRAAETFFRTNHFLSNQRAAELQVRSGCSHVRGRSNSQTRCGAYADSILTWRGGWYLNRSATLPLSFAPRSLRVSRWTVVWSAPLSSRTSKVALKKLCSRRY